MIGQKQDRVAVSTFDRVQDCEINHLLHSGAKFKIIYKIIKAKKTKSEQMSFYDLYEVVHKREVQRKKVADKYLSIIKESLDDNQGVEL